MALHPVVLGATVAVGLVALVVGGVGLREHASGWWTFWSVCLCLVAVGLLAWGISLRDDSAVHEFLVACGDEGGEPFLTGSEVRYSLVPTGAASGATVDVSTRWYLYECRVGGRVLLTLDSPVEVPEAQDPSVAQLWWR